MLYPDSVSAVHEFALNPLVRAVVDFGRGFSCGEPAVQGSVAASLLSLVDKCLDLTNERVDIRLELLCSL